VVKSGYLAIVYLKNSSQTDRTINLRNDGLRKLIKIKALVFKRYTANAQRIQVAQAAQPIIAQIASLLIAYPQLSN